MPIVLAALALAPMGGCGLFGGGRVIVPQNVDDVPGMALVRGGELTPVAFARVFPPVQRFRLSSRILARYRRIFGKIYLDLSLVAEGTQSIRMKGQFPGNGVTAFDLLVRGGEMAVYVPQAGTFFRGPIPEEGSPFGRRFGVEPADLIPIVLIGQRLASGDLVPVEGSRKPLFEPTESAYNPDGLVRVELDPETMLPRRATWRRGKIVLNVRYRAWDIFPDRSSSENRPMLAPSRFTVVRKRPHATIEIMPRPIDPGDGPDLDDLRRQYIINPELHPRTFDFVPPRNVEVGTLDDLDRVLSGR